MPTPQQPAAPSNPFSVGRGTFLPNPPAKPAAKPRPGWMASPAAPAKAPTAPKAAPGGLQALNQTLGVKSAYGGSIESGEWDRFDPHYHRKNDDPNTVADALDRFGSLAKSRGHSVVVSPYRDFLDPEDLSVVERDPAENAKVIRERVASGGYKNFRDHRDYPRFYSMNYARGPRRAFGLLRGGYLPDDGRTLHEVIDEIPTNGGYEDEYNQELADAMAEWEAEGEGDDFPPAASNGRESRSPKSAGWGAGPYQAARKPVPAPVAPAPVANPVPGPAQTPAQPFNLSGVHDFFQKNPAATGAMLNAFPQMTAGLASFGGGLGLAGLTDLLTSGGKNFKALLPPSMGGTGRLRP